MLLCWSVLSWHLKRTLHPRVLQSLCNLLDSCRGVQPFDIAKQCYHPPGLYCRTVWSSYQKKKSGGMLGSQRGEDPWGFLTTQASRISELQVQWQRLSQKKVEKWLRKTTYINLCRPQAHACVCAHPIHVCPYLHTHECIHKSHKSLF